MLRNKFVAKWRISKPEWRNNKEKQIKIRNEKMKILTCGLIITITFLAGCRNTKPDLLKVQIRDRDFVIIKTIDNAEELKIFEKLWSYFFTCLIFSKAKFFLRYNKVFLFLLVLQCVHSYQLKNLSLCLLS